MISGFTQGSAGYCYLSIFLPKSTPSAWVLCFPPFAEEQNKSRKMMSAQARDFTSAGFAVVIPDLFGTGDSTGDFADASWDIWRQDMLLLLQWIRKQGGEQIHFWGIRLGALLALDVHRHSDQSVASFLFWQPICNGKQASTQFLRLRMAAGLMEGGKQNVSDLRDQLLQDKSLEVAGYEVTPQLISSIDELSTLILVPASGSVVHWLEVSTNIDKPLPMQARKSIDLWLETGIEVHPMRVEGDAFWAAQDIVVASDLINCSTRLLADDIDAPFSQNPSPDVDQLEFCVLPELPITFTCKGSSLPGIVHYGGTRKSRGVVLVVGGPQYRVGSHRQFVLLARALSAQGIPVFRFDYRGMGDGEGPMNGFEEIEYDIRAAIDAFQERCPELKEVVIWGLCDAATAATFYAQGDPRVQGLVLLNPWVRSEVGEAKAYIRHYYLKRLLSRDFWRKIADGEFDLGSSTRSFVDLLLKTIGMRSDGHSKGGLEDAAGTVPPDLSLVERVERSLLGFRGEVLLILSENDLTAKEFMTALRTSPRLKKLFRKKRYTTKTIANSDHTFSRRVWRDQVAQETASWLTSW